MALTNTASPNAEHTELPSEGGATTEKRKHEDDTGPTSKRAKPSKSSKISAGDLIDVEASINNAFSCMDSQLLADYVAKRIQEFERDLSAVELEDKYLPARIITDATSWGPTRNLQNLPRFVEAFAGGAEKLKSSSKKNGAPHTIVVAAAGLRASNLTRALRVFQTKDAKVAKLFAKHIKLKEAVQFLQTTRVGIAVGTPVRLRELVDNGALSTHALERVVIDASHVDLKKRGVLETRETLVPIVNWLGGDLKENFAPETGKLRLLFY